VIKYSLGFIIREDYGMILKYTLCGRVRNTGKPVFKYVSVPLGITQEELFSSVKAFKKAFEQVKVQIEYAE